MEYRTFQIKSLEMHEYELIMNATKAELKQIHSHCTCIRYVTYFLPT